MGTITPESIVNDLRYLQLASAMVGKLRDNSCK